MMRLNFALLFYIVFSLPGSLAVASAIYFGSDVTQFDYKESLPYPAKSSESGQFPFYSFWYHANSNEGYDRDREWMFELSHYAGKSQYDGTTLNTATPVKAIDNLFFYDTSLRYGFVLNPQSSFYMGYGFHFWGRYLAGNPGYLEDYSWSYLPVGFIYNFQFDRTNLTLDVGYKIMLSGKIKVYAKEADPSSTSSPTLDLGNKGALRFRAKLYWDLTPKIGIVLAPFYEIQEIGESSRSPSGTYLGSSGIIYEPASTTTSWGSSLMLWWNLSK